jgi:PAS domain S-box-containing protein
MISPLLLFLYFILIIILTVFLHHIIQQSKSKKVKELLAESHNLISVSKDILCILSPNWFILQVNPSFEKILSYDRMEIINQNFSIILSPDEKDNFLTIRKSLASQERLKFTTKLISKEGEEKWISWYAFFDKHSLKIYAAGRDITNENLFLQQLQQSEERARKQFKSIPIPTYTWKRQGNDYVLVDYNDMVFRMTKGEVQNHIGIRASELLKNNYQVLRDMDYCYITRRPVHKEIDFYVEEDHTKLSYITNYAFVSPDSVMIHMEDVTEKKNIETKLKNNEEKYRALFNTSTDAIILFDLDGKIIDCNNASSNLFAYQHEELIGITVNQLFDSKQNTSLDTRIITNAEEFVLQFIAQSSIDGFIEIACKKKDNSLFPAEIQTQYITFKKDKIVLLYARDISERKKLEDELKESSARLQIAFESLPFDFWFVDNELRVLMQSNRSKELWGNILDKTLYEVDLPDEIKDSWAKDCKYVLTGEKLMHEVRYNYPTKKIFYQMIVPLEIDNEIKGLLGINIDFTQSRLREEELKKYSIDLERVNQELKSFAYIVSHDLKAPLRAITTIVDWLVTDYTDKLDDEGKSFLSLLDNRANRMHDLIDGILRYSKAGRDNKDAEMVNTVYLVNDLCQMLIIPDNINVEVDENLPTFEIDKVQLEQVFQNLISNAIKFIDKEHGLITVKYIKNEIEHIFAVEDNGPGIDEKYFDKIFNIFQTLKPRDEFESTGVGLSIVKKIIENLDGKVWLESKIGEGTTFYFSIPKQNNKNQ